MSTPEQVHFETEVLVIGSGGAGMYAAIEAARAGHDVVLADRSLIGRSGATVMAMMTVAVALGVQREDAPAFHLADTLSSGQGLCDEDLSRLLCEEGPECILEMDEWGVGWARQDDVINSAFAPGHDRPRCVYVDFLSTGPAVSKTLRKVLHDYDSVKRIGDLLIVDLVKSGDRVTGAVAIDISSGRLVTIEAKVTIIATGGLTRLFRRSSAAFNMGGDGYALALRAGARLMDMEFVQFFPIGHLAPRLIGLDPIMWAPCRYKLGGRLLNADMEEFTSRYGTAEDGRYVITRDAATYAITKEVAAGRGTPHGGVYLSFMHLPEKDLRDAFGPVIDKLSDNGIDLTKMPIEVSPIAHYHMGGIEVNAQMETGVPGLLAAGEAVGGANGANRLSGNAITEALVFGRCAGRTAVRLLADEHAAQPFQMEDAQAAIDLASASAEPLDTARMVSSLQDTMSDNAGPFKSADSLAHAQAALEELKAQLGERPPGKPAAYDPVRVDWFDLRNMLLVAQTVVDSGASRNESRGAHQREDFPGMLEEWTLNQYVKLEGDRLLIEKGQQKSVAEAAE